MSKILVTGSDGYIGRLVTQRLVEDGHDVWCLDLKRGDDIANFVNGNFDHLVHLAAFISVGESEDDPHMYWANNVSKYRQLLFNNRNYFGHITFASSFAVYDDRGRVNPKSMYGMSKLAGEELTRVAAERHSILRFANPIGVYPCHRDILEKTKTPNVAVYLARAALSQAEFRIHDDRVMTRDFFHVSMIVNAISIICSTNSSHTLGTHNLGTGIETGVRQMLLDACSRYNIPHRLVDVPEGVTTGSHQDISSWIPQDPWWNASVSQCVVREVGEYIELLSGV